MATPIKEVSYYVVSGGKTYKVCQDGDVLVARERGVSLGDVRMFFFNSTHREEHMYFAEREFKPFWYPIVASKIWWRKIKD